MMQVRPEITIRLKLGLAQQGKEGKMKWRINYVPDNFFKLVHGEFILERDEETGDFYLGLTGHDYSRDANRARRLTEFKLTEFNKAYFYECPDCKILSPLKECIKCDKKLTKEHRKVTYKTHDKKIHWY